MNRLAHGARLCAGQKGHQPQQPRTLQRAAAGLRHSSAPKAVHGKPERFSWEGSGLASGAATEALAQKDQANTTDLIESFRVREIFQLAVEHLIAPCIVRAGMFQQLQGDR